ncbi:SxtJ family membrane protein [Candidatus Albibeggiatoa sp. nov. NOAA]|uniref:SxtJ family membrane protein n=1 Tax=Candidatus Albibeggiatoa sp. nov. NOAA TaxID=3162724 RepID=UPI0032F4D243|nr:SxtJ family membrane protein [Thiotrichaceae bacterium]
MHKQLREFGLIMAGMIAGLFGIIFPYLFSKPFPLTPWIIAAVFVGFALIVPIALRPVFWLWMRIGDVLGWINTRLILGILFYFLITPLALVMRIFGYRPLELRAKQPELDSYRTLSKPRPIKHIERPF